MNLVLFTKNPALKDYLRHVLPASLSQVLFEKEAELSSFLADLKIPTQVILDKDTYKKEVRTLIRKFDQHHFICLTIDMNFDAVLHFIRFGAVLITWEQLNLIDWWWNRAQIKFQHKKNSFKFD
jgi:hypothetical protein